MEQVGIKVKLLICLSLFQHFLTKVDSQLFIKKYGKSKYVFLLEREDEYFEFNAKSVKTVLSVDILLSFLLFQQVVPVTRVEAVCEM